MAKFVDGIWFKKMKKKEKIKYILDSTEESMFNLENKNCINNVGEGNSSGLFIYEKKFLESHKSFTKEIGFKIMPTNKDKYICFYVENFSLQESSIKTFKELEQVKMFLTKYYEEFTCDFYDNREVFVLI